MTYSTTPDLVDLIAHALIDADQTMLGHHETHLEAKRPAARKVLEALRPFLREEMGRGRGR